MAHPELPREELAATIEARRELGKDAEPALVEAFLDRIEKEIDRRVDDRLARKGTGALSSVSDRGMSLAVPLGTIGMAIPITAIASSSAGLAGIAVAWLGIATVNVAYALARFRR
jgi:hypothetical protein